MRKIDNGYILVLGGTGFIGRAFVWHTLQLGYNCILISRKINKEVVLQQFISVWGEKAKYFLEKCLEKRQLVLVLDFDYSVQKNVPILLELLKKLGIKINKLGAIFNLSGSTSDNSQEIENSLLGVALFLKDFVITLRKNSIDPIVIHLSSVAAKYPFELEPPYEKAKRLSEKLLKDNEIPNFNVYIGFAKGVGETKMKTVASKLWPFFSKSHLMYTLKVSVVDVECLATYFLLLIDLAHHSMVKDLGKNTDVYITNGTIPLGQMIYWLLSKNIQKQVIKPAQSSKILEIIDRLILFVKSILWELAYPKDQFKRRISQFMRLASMGGWIFFESRYNNLDFFGLKPSSQSQKLKFIKNAQIYLDRNYKLIYIIENLSSNKIAEFVSK